MSLAAALPANARARSLQKEPCLWINPVYRPLLARRGLCEPEDFLELSGTIICGHPDRHVVQVNLDGHNLLPALLKREHRVRWRDRLLNAAQGFGLVSKSRREAQTLRELAAGGIAC